MNDDHNLKEQLRQMPEVPSAEIWEMVCQHTGMDTRQIPPVRNRLRKPLMAAAAVTLLLLGTLVIHENGTSDHQVMTEIERPVVDSNTHKYPLALQLPDGTKVALCNGSRLSYKDGFKGATRDVWLSGQAEFNVAQNPAKPFFVHFGQGEVKVLGTDFNVMAWPDVPAEITLLSGKVGVTQNGITKLLKPSQQIIVNKDDLLVKTLEDPRESIGWEQKVAYSRFHNTELLTVLRQFARWYHVTISNPYKIKGTGITGKFEQQTSLDSNLVSIRDAERQIASVERRNDTIFLLPYDPAAIKYRDH